MISQRGPLNSGRGIRKDSVAPIIPGQSWGALPCPCPAAGAWLSFQTSPKGPWSPLVRQSLPISSCPRQIPNLSRERTCLSVASTERTGGGKLSQGRRSQTVLPPPGCHGSFPAQRNDAPKGTNMWVPPGKALERHLWAAKS